MLSELLEDLRAFTSLGRMRGLRSCMFGDVLVTRSGIPSPAYEVQCAPGEQVGPVLMIKAWRCEAVAKCLREAWEVPRSRTT